MRTRGGREGSNVQARVDFAIAWCNQHPHARITDVQRALRLQFAGFRLGDPVVAHVLQHARREQAYRFSPVLNVDIQFEVNRWPS
jgi:hypothetical protein